MGWLRGAWGCSWAGLGAAGAGATALCRGLAGKEPRGRVPPRGRGSSHCSLLGRICSSSSTGTSITGSGCADGASTCSGGTAAASAPRECRGAGQGMGGQGHNVFPWEPALSLLLLAGFLSLAMPSVCAWLTINSGVRAARIRSRICAARPELPCNRGWRKELLHAGQSQLHLCARHRAVLSQLHPVPCTCSQGHLSACSSPVPALGWCSKEKSLQSILPAMLAGVRGLASLHNKLEWEIHVSLGSWK